MYGRSPKQLFLKLWEGFTLILQTFQYATRDHIHSAYVGTCAALNNSVLLASVTISPSPVTIFSLVTNVARLPYSVLQPWVPNRMNNQCQVPKNQKSSQMSESEKRMPEVTNFGHIGCIFFLEKGSQLNFLKSPSSDPICILRIEYPRLLFSEFSFMSVLLFSVK